MANVRRPLASALEPGCSVVSGGLSFRPRTGPAFRERAVTNIARCGPARVSAGLESPDIIPHVWRNVMSIDLERLVRAWESDEDYDSSWLSQPWDQPDETATNGVAGGWACRIESVILIERETGAHVSSTYPTGAAAHEDFVAHYLPLYGEPEACDG